MFTAFICLVITTCVSCTHQPSKQTIRYEKEIEEAFQIVPTPWVKVEKHKK